MTHARTLGGRFTWQIRYFVVSFSYLVISAYLLSFSPLAATAQQASGKTRLDSWKRHQELADESPYKELAWEAMGPKFVGGRVESIASPRNDRKTIYVGVGAGGVWKSVNGGLTWKAIFSDQSTFAIGDVAVSESDPNVVWVGTGECHVSGSSYYGTGVFKSVDAGETWTNMGLHESGHIGSVTIDPIDPETVYIAAMGPTFAKGQRGIFKTTDGGKSFEQVLEAGRFVSFVDLVIDPFDRSRIFASAWDRRGEKSGVFRSLDAGKTWKRLTEGLPEKQIDRVAIDLSRSDEGVVYALMADRSSPNLARRRNAGLLFRSEDGGETWTRTHEGYVPTYVGWDFCDVRVSADDANHVFIGGLRLIESMDGGKTFQGEGGFAINKKVDEVFRLHPHRGIGMHLDVHDVWINPDDADHLMLGNDGGLYVSQDRGRTWLHLNNLPIAEFYRIHLDEEKPFQIWGGTQDNASFVGSSSNRFQQGVDGDWHQVFLDPWTGGDGFATFPDPNDSKMTYYTQQNGDLQRSRLGRLRSIKRIKPKVKAGETPLKFAWDTPFLASQHDGPTILYCAAQRVFRSTDRGDSWKSISDDLARNGLLALAESPIDSSRLAVGSSNGKIHLTIERGENWTSSDDLLPSRTVRDLILSKHDSDRVYVVQSGQRRGECKSYVFVSNDFGKSWESIVGNLPPESANVIAEDPADPLRLFLGTDLGVYMTEDGGKSWISLSKSLPTSAVVDLQLHAGDNKLVAATHGLSLFILDVSSIRD